MVWQRGPLPWSYEQKVGDFLKPGVRRLDIRGGIPDCEDGSFDLVTAYQTEYDLDVVVRTRARGLRRRAFALCTAIRDIIRMRTAYYSTVSLL